VRAIALRPAPQLVAEAEPVVDEREDAEMDEYFPPAPEPIIRQTRMPEVDEFPPVVRNQIRVQRGETPTAAPATETRRKTLLEKLAAFGITRQEDAPAPVAAPMRALANPNLASLRPQAAPAPTDYQRPAQARPAPSRPAQGQLDVHGRQAPRQAAEDEQLEIPAFLRRSPGG
jgi:cell division protein FtsZ